MAALSNQIDDCPVFLANLNVVDVQGGEFRSSQTTARKNGNHRKAIVAPRLWRTQAVECGCFCVVEIRQEEDDLLRIGP